MEKRDHLNHFYELLDELDDRLGERQTLGECYGRMGWPRRGVYFFFEPGEFREGGRTPRVVRVGTHALREGSKSTLWKRLRQHRGTISGKCLGGGSHRGSVFRRHIGSAIIRRMNVENVYTSWGVGSSADSDTRKRECQIEKEVSTYIRQMAFLWLEVDDEPGPNSIRGYIERNAIGLLSNYSKLATPKALDSPSTDWIGHHCQNEKVRGSGLWNSNHTVESYESNFLETLESHIK